MLESFLNKVGMLKACNFDKKRLQHRCFSVKLANFIKNTYFEEHLPTAASVHTRVVNATQPNIYTGVFFRK